MTEFFEVMAAGGGWKIWASIAISAVTVIGIFIKQMYKLRVQHVAIYGSSKQIRNSAMEIVKINHQKKVGKSGNENR